MRNGRFGERSKLCCALFGGRKDVYAYRWQNSDGRSGYSPARKHKDGPYLPLTDRAVIDHLAGKTTIGLYPLLQDNTTWFFAIDFDGKHGDPLEDARKVVGYCADWAIPAYLERSRSGAGAHVWIFFSAPVPAWKPRLLASRVLLPEAGAEMGEDAAFDRFFPNQDRHSGKSLGNLIALPLQGERLKHGCTAFLDTSNELAPFPDQWEFLASIERVDEAKLDELLQEFDLSDKDISQTPREAGPPDDEMLRRMAGGISEGEGRDEAAFTVARRFAARAFSKEEALALLSAWDQSNDPPLTETDGPAILQKKVESAYRRQAQKSSSCSPPPIGEEEQENKITLTPRGAADLIQNAPEVVWLVEDILPIGRGLLLTGPSGTGKSWVSLDLALSVDQGELWLGRFQCQKGTVLVVDEENGDALLKRRLTRLLKGKGLSDDGSACGIQFLSMAGVNLSDETCQAAMDRVLSEVKPALVIFDTFIRVHTADELSSREMAPISRILKEWYITYGCAFCINHHDRKPGAAGHDSQHAYRGSTEIQAFTDSHIDLRAVKGEKGVLNAEHVKGRFTEETEPFGVEIVDVGDGVVVRHTDPHQAKMSVKLEEAKEFIRGLVAGGDWISRKSILEAGKEAKHSKNTLDAARRAMTEEAELEDQQDGNAVSVRLKLFSSSHNTIVGEENKNEADDLEDVTI